MTPDNLLTEWSRLLIGSLARAGVTHAVISPGSRSTPFTWAALSEPKLTTRVIVDERAAAFYAVGHAKMTGVPVLLICTSGSAAANYFPAIVEADRSGTPLIVLTADRPFELQAADAPQTIDQVKLYGTAVRHFFELGMPDASAGALLGVRRIAAQAALFARGPVPGPIHINARARQPLEPASATDPAGRALGETVERLLGGATTLAPVPQLVPPADALAEIARACAGARRGVIVCGPMSPWQAPHADLVADLSRRTGFPILPEATSQLRFTAIDPAFDPPARVSAFDALLRSASFRVRFAPDVVLRIGATPTSTAWRELMERAALATDEGSRIAEHVIAPNGWTDPQSTATSLVLGSIEPALRALLAVLPGSRVEAAWLRFVADADRVARETMRAHTDFDESVAVRTALERTPPDAVVAVGNSLPVREVDSFSEASGHPLTVWSQRGANGIDGLIAGAAGAAAASRRPTMLLIGDVSALHDVGSFAVARDCDVPLAIVVLDNAGGRIFEQLPIARGETTRYHMDAWLTPPRLEFEALARAFGIDYAVGNDVFTLGGALDRALATPGATLVHVVLDGARTIPAHREFWAEVDRRVTALP